MVEPHLIVLVSMLGMAVSAVVALSAGPEPMAKATVRAPKPQGARLPR